MPLPAGNLSPLPPGRQPAGDADRRLPRRKLQAQRLSVVTLQGEWIAGDKPSKEVAFHRAVYLHNPACKAIVHLHKATHLTALSRPQGPSIRTIVSALYPYVVMRVGDVPVVPYYRPGDDRIAEALAGLAPRYNAFLLANHGPVVTGPPLREATNNTEELEETARSDVYPRQSRDPLPDRRRSKRTEIKTIATRCKFIHAVYRTAASLERLCAPLPAPVLKP